MQDKYEIRNILGDWHINSDLRVKFFLLYYRISRTIYLTNIPVVSKLHTIVYYTLTTLLFNSEVHPATKIGPGLRIFHPYLIIVNPQSVIGSNVTLRHGVTIGNVGGSTDACPIIEDGVEFGAYSTVLGQIIIPSQTKLKFGSLHYVKLDRDV